MQPEKKIDRPTLKDSPFLFHYMDVLKGSRMTKTISRKWRRRREDAFARYYDTGRIRAITESGEESVAHNNVNVGAYREPTDVSASSISLANGNLRNESRKVVAQGPAASDGKDCRKEARRKTTRRPSSTLALLHWKSAFGYWTCFF